MERSESAKTLRYSPRSISFAPKELYPVGSWIFRHQDLTYGHEDSKPVDKKNVANTLNYIHFQGGSLLANLRHPDYVRVLCGSLENLPAALAALHMQSTPTSSPLQRDHRDKKLHRRVRQLLEAHAKAAA